MKKLSVLMLVTVLIMGMVSGTSLADPSDGQVMELSLEQAVDYALEHNPMVKLAKVALEEKEKSYNQAEDTQEKFENLSGTLDIAIAKKVAPKMAKREYELAQVSLDYTKRSVTLAVESAYFNVLSTAKKVTVSDAAYRRAVEQHKMAEASFTAGTVAKNDVLGAEVALLKAQADLNTAKNNLDIAYMQLNRALGLALEQELKLTTRLQYQPAEEIVLDEVLVAAADSDKDLKSAEVTYQNTRDIFDLTAKFYTPNVYQYKDAKYTAEKTEVAYQEAKKDYQLRVVIAYKNLKAAQANYQMLVKSVEQAEEGLRLSKLRYEVGVATSLEVLQASEMLHNQELFAEQTLQQYNLLKAQFKHMVFGGASAASM